MFEEIPDNRSCDSEHISQHWCLCSQYERINSHENIGSIAEFVVNQVNRLLAPVSKFCVKLTLDKILSAFESSDTLVDYQKHYLIRIRLSVSPSQANFEATVRKVFDKITIVGDISRLDEYGNQSVCIDNSFLQKYCFCK